MTTTAHGRSTTPGQLLLPGQAAAPDGPVDLTMMWVMHHGFRRDLATFAGAAAGTPVDDRPTWQALASRWRLFSTVLHAHHTGEDDGLWPLLLQRVDAAGDAAGRATLEAMGAEHAGIGGRLAACTAGFARMAAGAGEPVRAVLTADVAAARAHLAEHLRHEETAAMPLLQAHLQHADWDRVGREHFDPHYSARDLLDLAAWALQDLPPEGVARMQQQAKGRVLVWLWRLVLRRRFQRRERRAFRYA